MKNYFEGIAEPEERIEEKPKNATSSKVQHPIQQDYVNHDDIDAVWVKLDDLS